jgi:phosphotransferase system enzyme I (PtsI)
MPDGAAQRATVSRLLRGRPASPGLACGPLWPATRPGAPAGAILTAQDMTPAQFKARDWSGVSGLLLGEGSPWDHVAVLARAAGLPLVIGLGPALLAASGTVILDGAEGTILLEPEASDIAAFEQRRREEAARDAAASACLDRPAVTRDGAAIAVQLAIGDIAELRDADPACCDGIGLVRTEFLFMGRERLPGEDAQFGVYRLILEWAKGRPVTLRLFDAGGDKPLPGLAEPAQASRGTRLLLAHQSVLRTQLRALLRASVHGTLRLVLPWVADPADVDAVRAVLDEERSALQDAGRATGPVSLGIMVETAEAVSGLDAYSADFVAVGSNDLLRTSRMAGEGAGQGAGPVPPSVLDRVRRVVSAGEAAGRPVTLCGDAASDPLCIPDLLRSGVRSLCVPPRALARTKLAISQAVARPLG